MAAVQSPAGFSISSHTEHSHDVQSGPGPWLGHGWATGTSTQLTSTEHRWHPLVTCLVRRESPPHKPHQCPQQPVVLASPSHGGRTQPGRPPWRGGRPGSHCQPSPSPARRPQGLKPGRAGALGRREPPAPWRRAAGKGRPHWSLPLQDTQISSPSSGPGRRSPQGCPYPPGTSEVTSDAAHPQPT